MLELGLVGGGHLHDAGNGAEIGGVVIARMGGAVGADIAGAVDGEAHRQVLDGDVVHHLVIGALQEGRIDGAEGAHALAGETRGESDGVLLGDADIENAGGENLGEFVEPGARGHGGGDGDDAGVVVGFLDQAFGKDRGIGRGVGDGLGLGAGDDVELGDAVIFVGGVFGRAIALALLGDDMDQDGTIGGVAHIVENGQQVIEIVAVNGADIIKAQLFEQRAAGEEGAGKFLGAAGRLVEDLRQFLGDGLGGLAHAAIDRARDQPRQIGAERAGGRGDRHVVVVEHDDEPRIHGAGIVHRLIGHAGRHGAIADDGDDIARFALQIAGDGHAQAGGNRGGGMAGPERVVFAFGAAGEAGEAVLLAQGADAVAAAGQDLMRIGLVADIPDDAVMRGIEDGVQRHGQLDDAEPGAQMAAGDRDGIDHFGAQLVGQLAQVFARHGAQIGRGLDGIEQGRKRLFGQSRRSFAKGLRFMNLFRRRPKALQPRAIGCAKRRMPWLGGDHAGIGAERLELSRFWGSVGADHQRLGAVTNLVWLNVAGSSPTPMTVT